MTHNNYVCTLGTSSTVQLERNTTHDLTDSPRTDIRPGHEVNLPDFIDVEDNHPAHIEYTAVDMVVHETADCVLLCTDLGDFGVPATAEGTVYVHEPNTKKVSELSGDDLVDEGPLLESLGLWNRDTFYGEDTVIFACNIAVDGDTTEITLHDGTVVIVPSDSEVTIID